VAHRVGATRLKDVLVALIGALQERNVSVVVAMGFLALVTHTKKIYGFLEDRKRARVIEF